MKKQQKSYHGYVVTIHFDISYWSMRKIKWQNITEPLDLMNYSIHVRHLAAVLNVRSSVHSNDFINFFLHFVCKSKTLSKPHIF